MVVVDYVVGGLHQHGADLDENPGRGAGIQGHNTAVSTEHNLVDPVPDEESKVPGDLPIRNLGVQHFLSIDRANRGRLGTEGVEPPELSLHLLRSLWDTLPKEVRVNFLPFLTGDCNIEEDCSRGSSYFLLGY